MSNVSATISFPASVASAIAAHAALQMPPTTLEAMVIASGVDGALSQALQSELRAQVQAGVVGADLKDMVSKDFNPLWNAAWQTYMTAKASSDPKVIYIPESLLTGIQARASKVAVVIAPLAPSIPEVTP